jgi:hypothetical protein
MGIVHHVKERLRHRKSANTTELWRLDVAQIHEIQPGDYVIRFNE